MIAFSRNGLLLDAALSGRLDSNTSIACQDAMMVQIEAGARHILLDMHELTYVSSAGLRFLLLVAKRVKQAGGQIVLFRLQPNVREVFEISGFLSLLAVCDDRDQALTRMPTPQASVT